jgi:hypothetical protein
VRFEGENDESVHRRTVAIAGEVNREHVRRRTDHMRTLLAFFLAIMVAIPVLAGPPADGTYKSTDIGGTMYTGFYSETWNGGPLSVGNTINEESFDGTTLGTQWKWYCAYVVAPPILLYNGVVGGNGQKIWQATYTGGAAWFDGAGPWAGAPTDPFYTATVDTWIATVTELYSGGVEVSTVKTVNATASFAGYPDVCIVLALSNLEKHGDGGTLPAGPPYYPDFMDGNTCASLGTTGPGEWGEVDDITYSILGCTVRTEETSWGAVKALYR